MKRYIARALTLASAGLLFVNISTAPAVVVTSSTSVTPLLQDNFETNSVGVHPTNAVHGTWTVNDGTSGSTVLVTNAPNPGALQGFNYVRLDRPGGGNAELNGNLASTVSTGTLQARWMTFVPVG